MGELPPKPPRFPPGLFKHYGWMLLVNALALYVDLHAAHLYARDGITLGLFVMCLIAAIALVLLFYWVRRTRAVLREWSELKRAWNQLNAFMKEREGRK